jgi:hypothetical protein
MYQHPGNNKAAKKITQYTAEDAMENTLSNLLRKITNKRWVKSERSLMDNETANFEFLLMTKAGRRVEILLNATPRQ